MADRELQHILDRYHGRLDSYSDRQYWRDNHAGQDMGALWRRISELEGENARLRRELDDWAKSYPLDYEPPDSCQCSTTSNPPCSWCTSQPAEDEEQVPA